MERTNEKWILWWKQCICKGGLNIIMFKTFTIKGKKYITHSQENNLRVAWIERTHNVQWRNTIIKKNVKKNTSSAQWQYKNQLHHFTAPYFFNFLFSFSNTTDVKCVVHKYYHERYSVHVKCLDVNQIISLVFLKIYITQDLFWHS